jgi:hydroxyethylthiazole kinase-like uncharacterized protein yjeF
VIELPSVSSRELPAVTSAQMREIDRLATSEFGIDVGEMLELAGLHLAHSATALTGGVAGRRITVLVGRGGNGAGGLVAARQLSNRGVDVHIVLALPVGRLGEMARERLATLVAMSVPCRVFEWDVTDGELRGLLAGSDLIIDALLGYGADGPSRGPLRGLVELAAVSQRRVLSLDLPSGVNPDTGSIDGSAIRAAATMTVALPKCGLLSEPGRQHSGRILLADIGLPTALYERAGLTFKDPFVAGSIVCLN